jgi:chromosome segregation ATPase
VEKKQVTALTQAGKTHELSIQKLNTENASLRKKVIDVDAVAQTKEQSNQKFIADNSALLKQIAGLEAATEKAKSELALTKENLQKSEKSRKKAEADLSKLQAKAEKTTDDNASLKTERAEVFKLEAPSEVENPIAPAATAEGETL